MSVLDALRAFVLLGLPLGLTLGLLLGPVASRREGGGGYASLPRRAARLGHVAGVMLPLIGGFYALAFAAWRPALDAPLLPAVSFMAGAALLVLVLFLSAWRPRARYGLPLPALLVLAGAIGFAVALLP